MPSSLPIKLQTIRITRGCKERYLGPGAQAQRGMPAHTSREISKLAPERLIQGQIGVRISSNS